MAKIKAGRHSSKKEAIAQQAALLFRHKGFGAASMRELAELMAVEAPSLYNHIGSKGELLQMICFRIAGEFTAQLNSVEAMTLPVTEKIETVIRFHIRMMLEHFDEVYVANHEWKYLEDPFLTDFLNRRRAYEKKLILLIEEGTRQKALKPVNAYVAVLTILSAVRGLEFWHRNHRQLSAATLENDMVDHLLKGLIK